MKNLNTYIIEKFKISKDIKVYDDYDIISVEDYKNKYSENTFLKLKYMYVIAQRHSNSLNKPVAIVSMSYDDERFAWCNWDDKYKIGSKNKNGNTILLKVVPNR